MIPLFPSCHEASRLLSLSQDTQLSRLTRIGLRLHLVSCTYCRRYARQLRLLRTFLEGYPERLPGPGLSSKRCSEIVDRLRQMG